MTTPATPLDALRDLVRVVGNWLRNETDGNRQAMARSKKAAEEAIRHAEADEFFREREGGAK